MEQLVGELGGVGVERSKGRAWNHVIRILRSPASMMRSHFCTKCLACG